MDDDDYRDDGPVMFIMGPCYSCRRLFIYNADRVPSIPLGPDGQPMEGGTREPICRACVERVNPQRIANGLDPIVILPGAYEPEPLR